MLFLFCLCELTSLYKCCCFTDEVFVLDKLLKAVFEGRVFWKRSVNASATDISAYTSAPGSIITADSQHSRVEHMTALSPRYLKCKELQPRAHPPHGSRNRSRVFPVNSLCSSPISLQASKVRRHKNVSTFRFNCQTSHTCKNHS